MRRYYYAQVVGGQVVYSVKLIIGGDRVSMLMHLALREAMIYIVFALLISFSVVSR